MSSVLAFKIISNRGKQHESRKILEKKSYKHLTFRKSRFSQQRRIPVRVDDGLVFTGKQLTGTDRKKMRLLRSKYYIKRWPPEMLAKLPDHYHRFMQEAKKTPSPVHYIPETGKNFEKDPVTGEIKRFQDCPIPLSYPKEHDQGLWGGEAIIQGYGKRKPRDPLFPKFYVPRLKRFVVYSEILDKYLSVIVTNRTLRLIDEAFGFDAYILRTPLADLGSQLAFDLRRMMLQALAKQSFYPYDPIMRRKMLDKYKDCIVPEEEADWFGLPLDKAMARALAEYEMKNPPKPLKVQYRQELLQRLNEWDGTEDVKEEKPKSWLNRINFFSSKS